MSDTSKSLEFQFIRHPDEGAIDVLSEITETFSGRERQRALCAELHNNPHKVDIQAWVHSLTESWSAEVKQHVQEVFPFSKATTTSFREFMDMQPDTVQNGVAAYIRLGCHFKVLPPLNGNQVRSIARKAWSEQGLRTTPVPFVATCPKCGQPAACSLVLDLNNSLQSSSLTCSGCQYHEEFDHTRNWSLSYFGGHETSPKLFAEFQAILSRQDEDWAQRTGTQLLQYLQTWFAQLDIQLKRDADAVHEGLLSMDRSRNWRLSNQVSRGWAIRQYGGGTFELASNVRKGQASPSEKENFDVRRPLDDVLDDVPANQFERYAIAVPDVACHWRERLNELCTLLADALATGDVCQSAALAADIAYSIDTFGLVCDIGFRWGTPTAEALRVAAKDLRKFPSESATAGTPPAQPLADFMSQELAAFGVTSEEVSVILKKYLGQSGRQQQAVI